MSTNMLLFFLFFSINAFWIQGIQSKSHGFFNYSNKGIVGGKTTTIEQHPYQVALVSGYNVGSTFMDRSGTVYTAKQIFSHPLFDVKTIDYDVGLIDLRKNIKLDGKTSKAISLPPPGAVVQPGTNVVVTGWGTTKEHGDTSEQLMEVTVPTVSNADCSKYYTKDTMNITQRMLCAGLPQGGKDSCTGDCGGPAVDNSTGVQLGVVSWGNGCARPFFPGVYTDLSNIEIRSWIKNVTGI